MTKPIPENFKNQQMSLFQNFLCNTDDERQKLSNSIELWDSVPRYSMSRVAMEKRRGLDGNLPLLKLEFEHRAKVYKVSIQPSIVEVKSICIKNGAIETKQIAYYPSVNEELVEEVLRKFAVDKQKGFFDKANEKSGVCFSLYQVRAELKKRGHSRSFNEIKRSLEILSGSVIHITTISGGNEINVKSAILPVVIGVNRREMVVDPMAKSLVQFHPLITNSIENFSYRQFNYQQLMMHKTQLARWLHKQLICKYVFASRTKNFEMRFSTIKRDSSMLENYKRQRSAQYACDISMEELKEHGLLAKIIRQEELVGRGKIMDIVYTLVPSDQFIANVKAASKRANGALHKLSTIQKYREV